MGSEIIQILREDGKLNGEYNLDLTNDELKKLFELMILTRTYEERSLKLQRSGRIGFYIGCKGQEASQIGSGYALRDTDFVFPAYREPGILFMRGVEAKTLVSQMMGNDIDPCKGRQMPCHFSHKEVNYGSISSPLGTQIPHAVGAAYAAKYRKEDTVMVTYFGDGTTSGSDFHSGLNFAGVFKVPVVFICQNNQWAISVPFSKQTASDGVAIKAKAYGIPGIRVDGNDILAVYQVTKEAVERARRGEGPTLIESLTYRLGSHSSSDDATRYRPEDEFNEWQKKDPLIRFEIFLKDRGILTDEDVTAIKENAENIMTEGIKEAEKVGNPPLYTIFTDVYKDMPPHLRQQMEDLISEQKRLGESEDSSLAFPL